MSAIHLPVGDARAMLMRHENGAVSFTLHEGGASFRTQPSDEELFDLAEAIQRFIHNPPPELREAA